MGFTIRIIFAAVEMAGEISSLTMGLGFATFFDPTTQGRSSAISQFLSLVATMAFLAVNAHLVLLAALVESFTTLPISATPIYGGGFKQLADWGGTIFSTGCSYRCRSWRLY
jgi:flagellar biosynthetic protein FliR